MSVPSSSSSKHAVPVLPPFRVGLFSLWKMQVCSVLMAYGLWDVVESGSASALIKEERATKARAAVEQAARGAPKQEAAAPASGTTAVAASGERKAQDEEEPATASPPLSKDIERDIDRSRRAYGALLSALGEVELRLCQFVPLGDAHGVWRVLLENYERRSLSTRVQLIEKFFALEQGRERANVFVNRLQETAQRLREQGETLSPALQLFVLLRGVTRRFPTLVTLLKMREELTFEEAVEAIRNEEERQKADGSDDELGRRGGRGLAFYTAAGAMPTKKKDPRRCHECGEVGHMKFSCPEITCMRCGRNGHVAANCKATRPSYNRGRGGAAARGEREEKEESEFAAFGYATRGQHSNVGDDEDEENDDWEA